MTRDYAADMRAIIEAETGTGPCDRVEVAESIVARLRRFDPDLLHGWLDTHAAEFVGQWVDDRIHHRFGRMAAVTPADGGWVVDAGSIGFYDDLDQARVEAAARGYDFPEILPAPTPAAPVDSLPPRRRNGRWAAGVRTPVRTPAATYTNSPEDSRV